MTQEQRQENLLKWLKYICRAFCFGLIIYWTLAYGDMQRIGKTDGAAFSLGSVIGWSVVLMATTDSSARAERIIPTIKQTVYHIHRRTTPRGEYIYVIKDIDISGYYKIGRTNDPSIRLSTFDVKLPFRIEVIAILTCKNAMQGERELHVRFASKRVRGEWFNLDDSDLEYLRGLTE